MPVEDTATKAAPQEYNPFDEDAEVLRAPKNDPTFSLGVGIDGDATEQSLNQ